jgi:TonB family protein
MAAGSPGDHSRRFRPDRGAWVLALLASMTQAQDLPANEPGDEPARLRTLDDLDQLIAWQTRAQWKLRENGGAFGVDRVGKQISAYAEEFIYTDEVAAELRSLREIAAQQSGRADESGLHTSLERASAIEVRQWKQTNILTYHFVGDDRIVVHEAILVPLLARVPASEQERTRARLQSLQLQQTNKLAERLRSAAEDAATEGTQTLIDAYNEERGRLAEIVAREDIASGRTLRGRDVNRPCTPPHPAPTGAGHPSIDQSNLALPAYPDEARRVGIDGRVILRARVSAQGCPERLEVMMSIGYEPLDLSALDWGETLRFHPAVSGGRPVATTYEFAATFRLYD